MQLFWLTILLPACLAQFVDDSALIRVKKQAVFFYICGARPNQYYSVSPCPKRAPTCTNGGLLIGFGCKTSVDCTPFYAGVSQCINNCCCTTPPSPTTQPSARTFGVCGHGQLSEVRCSRRSQCARAQSCLNGLCCTATADVYNFACGGEAALGSCSSAGRCPAGQTCTSSNYCCECPVGTTPGKCGPNGSCPAGFSCHFATGFCCASCPGAAMPYGACRNGTCGGGRLCFAGNLCC